VIECLGVAGGDTTEVLGDGGSTLMDTVGTIGAVIAFSRTNLEDTLEEPFEAEGLFMRLITSVTEVVLFKLMIMELEQEDSEDFMLDTLEADDAATALGMGVVLDLVTAWARGERAGGDTFPPLLAVGGFTCWRELEAVGRA